MEAKWEGGCNEAGKVGTGQNTQCAAGSEKENDFSEEQQTVTEGWYTVIQDVDAG